MKIRVKIFSNYIQNYEHQNIKIRLPDIKAVSTPILTKRASFFSAAQDLPPNKREQYASELASELASKLAFELTTELASQPVTELASKLVVKRAN